MSRIIHTQSPARHRTKLLQQLVMALRWSIQQETSNTERMDLTAFVVLALAEIDDSVTRTAASWEKRGYWLKADRFVQEWSWAASLRDDLESALREEDDHGVRETLARLVPHLVEVNILSRLPSVLPWEGAWQQWHETRQHAPEIDENQQDEG